MLKSPANVVAAVLKFYVVCFLGVRTVIEFTEKSVSEFILKDNKF